MFSSLPTSTPLPTALLHFPQLISTLSRFPTSSQLCSILLLSYQTHLTSSQPISTLYHRVSTFLNASYLFPPHPPLFNPFSSFRLCPRQLSFSEFAIIFPNPLLIVVNTFQRFSILLTTSRLFFLEFCSAHPRLL